MKPRETEWGEEPPGNEKDAVQGVSLADLNLSKTSNGIVDQGGRKVKLPDGTGFDNGYIVPTVEHSTRRRDSVAFQFAIAFQVERHILRFALHRRKIPVAAVFVALGDDRRSIDEVIETSGVSRATFFRHLRIIKAEIASFAKEQVKP